MTTQEKSTGYTERLFDLHNTKRSDKVFIFKIEYGKVKYARNVSVIDVKEYYFILNSGKDKDLKNIKFSSTKLEHAAPIPGQLSIRGLGYQVYKDKKHYENAYRYTEARREARGMIDREESTEKLEQVIELLKG